MAKMKITVSDKVKTETETTRDCSGVTISIDYTIPNQMYYLTGGDCSVNPCVSATTTPVFNKMITGLVDEC